MKKPENINAKEAQEALDSVQEMQDAGLSRILPPPIWLGAILGGLIGTQIALLGAEIRTYNTILIVLILMMAIAMIHKNQSAGVKERILISKRAIVVSLICIIPLYFLSILASQYLIHRFDYTWAPVVIGALVTIGFWSLIVGAHRAYRNRFKEGRD